MTQALYYVVKTLAQLYMLLYLLRFWLPWVRADFRNPIAQAILRFTSPLIVPLRRFIPPIGRLDTATVLVLFAMQYGILFVLMMIVGQSLPPAIIAQLALIELIIISLWMFLFAIFISILMSWISPGNYNPFGAIASTLAEPILRPFRRLLPPFSGIDLSPILAIVLVRAIIIVVESIQPYGA